MSTARSPCCDDDLTELNCFNCKGAGYNGFNMCGACRGTGVEPTMVQCEGCLHRVDVCDVVETEVEDDEDWFNEE